MNATALCLLMAVVQAEPADATKPKPFVLADDEYLRASDFGMHKFTVEGEIGGDTVLSFIQLVRTGGEDKDTIQFEEVIWSRAPKRVQEPLLVFDSTIFFADKRSLRIRGLSVDERIDLGAGQDLTSDNVSVGRQRPRAAPEIGEYRQVVSIGIHGNNNDQEKKRIAIVTRRAKLSDYPVVQKQVETTRVDGFTYSLGVVKASKELVKFLD